MSWISTLNMRLCKILYGFRICCVALKRTKYIHNDQCICFSNSCFLSVSWSISVDVCPQKIDFRNFLVVSPMLSRVFEATPWGESRIQDWIILTQQWNYFLSTSPDNITTSFSFWPNFIYFWSAIFQSFYVFNQCHRNNFCKYHWI